MEQTAGSTSSIREGGATAASRPLVPLGRIAGAHGLGGEVRVRCFLDAREPLLRVPRVTVGEREDALCFEVAGASLGRAGEVRLALVGVEGREAALALRGRLLRAAPEHFAALPEDEFYGYELIGCRVEDADGRAIGIVRDIWPTGAKDVLVVGGEGGEEHLIPAAWDLLREVDVAGRRIVVEAIPGLLDTA